MVLLSVPVDAGVSRSRLKRSEEGGRLKTFWSLGLVVVLPLDADHPEPTVLLSGRSQCFGIRDSGARAANFGLMIRAVIVGSQWHQSTP